MMNNPGMSGKPSLAGEEEFVEEEETKVKWSVCQSSHQSVGDNDESA